MQRILSLQHASIHRQEWYSKGEEAGPTSCKRYGLELEEVFFFYLGPVCLSSGFKHRSLVAYCAKEVLLLIISLQVVN